MATWLIVLLSVLVIYGIGFLGMWAYLRGSNIKMAVLWPLTLAWMLFGNIQ